MPKIDENMDVGLSEDEENLDGASEASQGGTEDEDKMLESDGDAELEVDNDASEDEANEAERKVLEDALAKNPYDYESHLALVNLCHKMADLERLREARKDMSSKFPLNADIWISWLSDEITLATSKEDKENVVKLFERALQDYICRFFFFINKFSKNGNLEIAKNMFTNTQEEFFPNS